MDLSPAEYKVAELVARGFAEKEIAVKLFISKDTVHNHTYSIRKKWKARSAVDVARIFILKQENPKKFFTALVFLIIQSNIIFNGDYIEARKPFRSNSRICRTYKPSRKQYD